MKRIRHQIVNRTCLMNVTPAEQAQRKNGRLKGPSRWKNLIDPPYPKKDPESWFITCQGNHFQVPGVHRIVLCMVLPCSFF
jgi:hypothetical protein